MGSGKSTLTNDVVEEDFGRKVVLNTISPSSFVESTRLLSEEIKKSAMSNSRSNPTLTILALT